AVMSGPMDEVVKTTNSVDTGEHTTQTAEKISVENIVVAESTPMENVNAEVDVEDEGSTGFYSSQRPPV
ncbi:hypothetical protein, partial [Psychroserpens mesophilus]|uniref:hypothetical protein n=1 Tax=Psychroserpens mesophilus TaxID=325473 RepID=UPI003D650E40